MRNEYVNVSRARLPQPFLLRSIGQCRDQCLDLSHPCSWGRLGSRPLPDPFKGRGRQPLGESTRAHFCLFVPISASLMHTHSYAGSWVRT
jgi:hypothetical protein